MIFELMIAFQALEKAKGIILKNGNSIVVTEKNYIYDLVTNIDREAEMAIRKIITDAFPMHSVLGEEFGFMKKSQEYVWVIDPIDGTANFIKYRKDYAISIALIKGGKPYLGVVADVAYGKIYHSISEKGAFMNNHLLDSSACSINSLRGYSLRNNSEPYRGKIEQITDSSTVKWEYGMSTALALCRVASGECDSAFKLTYHPWDVCAAVSICLESGCRVCDFSGNDLDFSFPDKRNMSGFIASRKENFKFVFDELTRLRRIHLADL